MILLPRLLSVLALLAIVAVCPARAEESEVPQLHELQSKDSEAPQLQPPEEDGNNGENNASHECAASGTGNCATADDTGGALPVPADDEAIESVLSQIKAAPEVKLEYFAHLPSGPEGEKHDHRFPIKLSPSQMASLTHSHSGNKEAGQATLLFAVYQARPHILALKPSWKCQVCGRPARTTLGSPAFITMNNGDGIIVDRVPFVLCGDTACEEEAKRQTMDMFKKASSLHATLQVQQVPINKIPLNVDPGEGGNEQQSECRR